MFGLISKKKLIEIVKPLAKDGNNPVLTSETEQGRINEFYYK